MKNLFKVTIYLFALIGFILVVGYISVKMGWTNTKGVIDKQEDYFQDKIEDNSWSKGEEWQVLKEAIIKDTEVINKVSRETGISSRIIVMPLVVEQLRLFHSEREIFKTVFAPLKILGNQSQFSWGVMGIKQETAKQIEERLTDSQLLAFKTDNPDKERFERLTDENDRYYSYLYAAIYMKELMDEWKKAGFPIDDKPDIIATLYNIGFENSHPNANPQSGGAEIEISGVKYSFGSLARSFYYSKELISNFPTSSPLQ